jgi:peptidoglycan/xylan/chitin deacetylase (PgdA/CDA1 family)
MYHSLDDSGSVISVGPRQFREQMQVLRDGGFTGISLQRLLDGWEARSPLPDRPVVITFDDAFANVSEHGIPVLAEHAFGATIFAVSGYCGRRNDWPTQPGGVPVLPLMSMRELRDLSERGFEIGAHTVNHPPLDRTSPEETAREMTESRQILQDGVGRSVVTFAYPYGAANAHARGLAAQHFQASCSTAMGKSRPSNDRSWLPRIEMFYFRKPRLLGLLGTTRGDAYIAARSVARAVRGLFESSPPLPTPQQT